MANPVGKLFVSVGFDLSRATGVTLTISGPNTSGFTTFVGQGIVETQDKYTIAGLFKANTYVSLLLQPTNFSLPGTYIVRTQYSGPPPLGGVGPFYPSESCNATFTLPP